MTDRQDGVVWWLSITVLYLALLVMTVLWAKHMLTVLRAHEKNDHDGLSVETLVSTIVPHQSSGRKRPDLLRARFEESASSGESPTIRFPLPWIKSRGWSSLLGYLMLDSDHQDGFIGIGNCDARAMGGGSGGGDVCARRHSARNLSAFRSPRRS
jgi:hypothetical protein